MRSERERLLDALGRLRARLPADAEAATELRAAEEAARAVLFRLQNAEHAAERYHAILGRAVGVLETTGSEAVADRILDTLLQLLKAERGFLALGSGKKSGWEFLAARHLSHEDLAHPDREVSTSIIARAEESGEACVVTDAQTGALAEATSVRDLNLRSVACIPFHLADHGPGFIYVDNRKHAGMFDDTTIAVLQSFLPIACDALRRSLEERAGDPTSLPGVIGRSAVMKAELRKLARVAPLDVSILLVGETGTGKSLAARRVHEVSERSGGTFVHVNCGAIPESLIEAELFGAEKGAYTGIDHTRPGKFEQASGGTLFLDELQAMPASCQVKLLVALQEQTVTRLGGTRPVPVDVRVIAAMNLPSREALEAGVLREDLYYRLAVIIAHLPALRDRPEDLDLLAEGILDKLRRKLGSVSLSESARKTMRAHSWPGNVRELENALERAALLSPDGVIRSLELAEPSSPHHAPSPHHSPSPPLSPSSPAQSTRRRKQVTREEMTRAWTEHDGDIAKVAETLGVHHNSVWRIRKRLGLTDDE